MCSALYFLELHFAFFMWCQTLETWCFFSFPIYLYFTISRHELSRISHGSSSVPIAACSHVWKYWLLFVTEELLEREVLWCSFSSSHSRSILIVLHVFSWKVIFFSFFFLLKLNEKLNQNQRTTWTCTVPPSVMLTGKHHKKITIWLLTWLCYGCGLTPFWNSDR